MGQKYSKPADRFNARQLLFKELFVGTLIYAVVLGLCNDYTKIVEARSFSTILFASIALECLTVLAFKLKERVLAAWRNQGEDAKRITLIFSIWLIMFLSKFVFLWVIDLLFGNYLAINGFFGILFIVATVTIVHKLADLAFRQLGNK